MANYRILSDNTSLGAVGDTVSDEQLVGYNAAALVAGGHIEPIAAKFTKKQEQDKD